MNLLQGGSPWTCTLYFRNAHLPEVQEAVCKVRQGIHCPHRPGGKKCHQRLARPLSSGKERQGHAPEGFHLPQCAGKGATDPLYRVFSHASGAEFDSLPPTFSLYIYMQLNQKYVFSLPMECMTSVFSAVFAPSFFLPGQEF